MRRSSTVIFVILIIVILDQWLKYHIKTTYSIGSGFDMFGLSWAKIHFIENEGMAFGLTFGGEMGKLALSLFRLIMVSFLGYMIIQLIRAKESIGLLICFALIIAGALGNIIDSALYGVIFSESDIGRVAELFPEEGGYGKFLHGKVVDMLYFPMINTNFPEWFPIWGGERFQFFRPVFNIADASISTGVISILVFHRKFFQKEEEKPKENLDNIELSGNNDVTQEPDKII